MRDQANDAEKDRGFWSIRSFRFALIWLLCLVMLANTYSCTALSMAMVCMVNSTALAMMSKQDTTTNVSNIDNTTNELNDCSSFSAQTVVDYGGHLIWTSADQGMLFAAMYWGGIVATLPSGWLINRYGSKRTITFSLIITLICTVTTPVAALYGGVWATFFARFFMGFGGLIVIYMAFATIISQWIPPNERSTAMAISLTGIQIGMITGMPINSALCQNKQFLGGWPSIFYLAGFVNLVAAVVWQIFADDSPAQSRWISKRERSYIEKLLHSQNFGDQKNLKKKTPWRRILSSNIVWCCATMDFALGFMGTTLASYIPTYYKQALHINLEANGLLSAVPFLAQWISKLTFSVIADALKKHTRIDHTLICKVFNTIGTIVGSAFLVACAFMSCHHVGWAIALVSLANATLSGLVPGFMTALVSFAPPYTGIVTGMSRFGEQVSSLLAPYIVGSITRDGTAEEWRIVFYIMAGTMAVAGIYFLFAGTVEIQEWAKMQTNTVSDISEDGQVKRFQSTPAIIVLLPVDNDKTCNGILKKQED